MPPSGKLDITVTYLEMRQKPTDPAPPPPRSGLHILHAARPTVSFYRYLFNTIGEPWLWASRRKTPDDELKAILHDDANHIDVLYVDGVPAGYAEIDFGPQPNVELLFFGLIPEFIGQGLGPYFLRHAIDTAWSRNPSRFWLHTCTLDHPKAVSVYRRAGFEPYKQERKLLDDPRISGLI